MRMRLIALGVGIGCLSAVGSAFVLVGLPFGTDGTTIQGCYSSGGALKVLTPSEPACPKGYMPISWSVTGPAGPQGAQGIQGIPGPQGDAGPQGPAGASQVYVWKDSHVVQVAYGQEPQQIVALTGLPAGAYIFYLTIVNEAYVDPSGDFYTEPISCYVKFNGQNVHLSSGQESTTLDPFEMTTEVMAVNAPEGSNVAVSCTLPPVADEPASLGLGRITALRVGSIN